MDGVKMELGAEEEVITHEDDNVTVDYRLSEDEIVVPPLVGPSTTFKVETPFEFPLAASQTTTTSTVYSTESDESEDGENVSDDGRENGEGRQPTCRKEKSLGLLCQRFLTAMKEETASSSNNSVHLETVAQKMKVEKRRIYDIVNVMEALDAMSKLNKSYYAWHGLGRLPRLMHELQREAIEENLPSRILRVEQAMCSFTELSPGAKRKDIVGTLVDQQSLSSSFVIPSPSTSSSPYPTTSPADSPFSVSSRSRILTPTQSFSPSTSLRDPKGMRNSLAMLCRRFIMVLLANPQDKRRVSLDVASTVLIKDPETEGFEPPSRGRCRRLYDIANVLVAMGIIRKVHYLFGTKKIPLFIYDGPEPDENGILTDEKLEEMLLLPRKAIDECIKEKTFGKRSKSEACLGDVLRQHKGSKISRMGSINTPQHSPMTAWKMMELANAAEKERLMRERLSFVIPLSPSSRIPNRLSQSTSNLSPTSAWSSTLSPSAIPTSPLALPGQFVLPRTQPWTLYRTQSDIAANIGVPRGSPKAHAQSPLSASSVYRILQPSNGNHNAGYGSLHSTAGSSSPKAAVRRVLAPLQPTVSSPRSMGRMPGQKKTPNHSIKRILGPSPARNVQSSAENSPDRVSINGLSHRGSSLFKPVKPEARRVLGQSNAFNTAANTLTQMRFNFGV